MFHVGWIGDKIIIQIQEGNKKYLGRIKKASREIQSVVRWVSRSINKSSGRNENSYQRQRALKWYKGVLERSSDGTKEASR